MLRNGPPVTLGDGRPKEAGTWDWYGRNDPAHGQTGVASFSIGLFQWEPNASGEGTKKGKIVKRLLGPVQQAAGVYAHARAFISSQVKHAPPAPWPGYSETMPPIPEVTALDLAFGTARHLPQGPQVPPHVTEGHLAARYVECRFFKVPIALDLYPRYEITQEQGQAVIDLVDAHLGSREHKHEVKILGCAALLDRYFTVQRQMAPP